MLCCRCLSARLLITGTCAVEWLALPGFHWQVCGLAASVLPGPMCPLKSLARPTGCGAAAQIPLPEAPPWWELHNVSWGEVCEVCCEVHALYARPKATYVCVGPGAGAPPPGALPTPVASPATAHGTPAASRQGGGSGGVLQNGDSNGVDAGGGASAGGGSGEPAGGSGDARDKAPGTQVRDRRGGVLPACVRGQGASGGGRRGWMMLNDS